MGASLSWYAVRGKTPEMVLRDFGLRRAVSKEYRHTPFRGGPLPNGWFVMIHGRHEFTSDEMRHLSSACEVVACFVEEHVMVSRSACWKNGVQVWEVTHDSEESEHHLDIRGEPPAGFGAIRDRLTKQQKEDDEDGCVDFIFNIPVDLAEEVTGFNHLGSSDTGFGNFVKPTFLQRLFER
ncbi:hypothetical protein DES53_102892 [Roseimicrobium gellanilyticum]|uniref:Uncharacterized protein n=1 Tax=Roseimicrobium gellanilyticum TaxID=748857 RepID=A0A366HS43_9BACT|nr:hypothetical protein DES53_102892 [Roseimicrobium gellanilyticum]